MLQRNLITDVTGVLVGNAADPRLKSGVTVVVFDRPAVASVSVQGGAPGTRDTEALAPEALVERIDAVVLSGGSAFGLDAASGVQAWLREQGRGLAVGTIRVPIVPQAILFDLLNGGDKAWGRYPPYRELAHDAARAASQDPQLGTAGAGYGATTLTLKGGLGSASARISSGATVGALVAVNALGSPIIGDGPHFWAAPWEVGQEYGGLGMPQRCSPGDLTLDWKGRQSPEPATTIAVIATDATLTKAEARRMAIVAHSGMARALRLTAAPFDGDTVFAAATCARPRASNPLAELTEIAAMGADCLARAIARGVYLAEGGGEGPWDLPSWQKRYGALGKSPSLQSAPE